MRSTISIIFPLLLAAAVPVSAQEPLSLADAVGRALLKNPAIRAADTAVGEAAARVTQARAGYLPRLDLIETAQRGNQPVYAFSSLLAARQFAPADFAIGSLNHPDAVTNYHTGLALEQPIFDGLQTKAAVGTAQIGTTLARTERARAGADIALQTTRAYGHVLLAAASEKSAAAAVAAAEQDVKRAEHLRDAGLATEADVLALRVHLAQMQERRIQSASERTIARAELNQAMGAPLDTEYVLDDPAPAPLELPAVAELEKEALSARPEMTASRLQQALARENVRSAKSAFLPRISLQAFVELNGNRAGFTDRASAWMFGAQAQWRIFSGLADVGRLRETTLASSRAAAEQERVETSVRVDIRTAVARVESARARQRVGQAAVAQAIESQRIVRDRYEAGMASVNDVLRAANALIDAESQRIGADVDLLVSTAMLDRARGVVPTITPNSQK